MRVIPNVNAENDNLSQLEQMQAEIDYLKHKVVIQETTINYLSRQAQQDALTGLLNRRGFMQRLKEAVSHHKRYGQKAVLMMVDVNDFKQVNDTYGHLAGDAVLRFIAEFLRTQVRDSDIVGRLAGDEFCVILQQADAKNAILKATKMMNILKQQPCNWAGQNIFTGISIGCASFDEHKNINELIEMADDAMYAQKIRKNA